MQIHGGMGFMRGTKVERIYREVKVNAIGGGRGDHEGSRRPTDGYLTLDAPSLLPPNQSWSRGMSRSNDRQGLFINPAYSHTIVSSGTRLVHISRAGVDGCERRWSGQAISARKHNNA